MRTVAALLLALAVVLTPVTPAPASPPTHRDPQTAATLRGPIPVGDTSPFFSADLAGTGYVEEEFYLSGTADGWSTTGERVATAVPYTTRVIVRRPVRHFNGTALVEWQNVTAGYDLDALWNPETLIRAGYAWVGVSAQRVGVDQLRGWSPARYGSLDVTGGGRFLADELSYDIFAQAGAALGFLKARTVLAIGASQSAARMTVYYDHVLPQVEPVFDGFGFVVGSAPSRVGSEPVFQVLSETDVRTPVRPADTGQFRRWEVAGAAHSGWAGQVYRRPLQERDLGGAPEYSCDRPPFSRVPMHHVTAAAYRHLERWVERGTPPPTAPPLQFNADGTKTRDPLGLAVGGIRLSQVSVPRAVNDGDNTGETLCRLFGSYQPLDAFTLKRLYPTHLGYVAKVVGADIRNVLSGYLLPQDALANAAAAARP